MDRHLHRLIYPVLEWEIKIKKHQRMQFCSTAASNQELANAHLSLHVLHVLHVLQDRWTPGAVEHQLRNNTNRILTTQHKTTMLAPGFPPRSDSLCGHCQSSGVRWGHVAGDEAGNGMAASGIKWLLDSRVVPQHSTEGNIILFLQVEQVHEEMKWLIQGQNLLLEIGQGCYSLPFPIWNWRRGRGERIISDVLFLK